VLIGVSRTSKTPLSMYLGHKGYKVANIPLIAHVSPPEALFAIDQNKIIALTIDHERLTEIRQARLTFLRGEEQKDETGAYANSKHVFEEIEWSRELFQKNRRWPVIDVTGKALEENAVEIERIILERFPQLETLGRGS
jgi:regulator of PEP synthase PpsR (kinase-PPPase family)